MNAKVLLTALALGGAAVYAAKRLSTRNGNRKMAGPKKMKSQRDSQAFSPVRTPAPPY
jgi:hypothetical protein